MSKLLLASLAAGGLILVNIGAPTEAANPATVAWVQNKVEFHNGAKWVKAGAGLSLRSGTYLRTGINSRMQINYIDGTVVRLGGQTVARVRNAVAKSVHINQGKAWLKVQPRSQGMKVRTPSAVATVLGTEFVVSVVPKSQPQKTSFNPFDVSTPHPLTPMMLGMGSWPVAQAMDMGVTEVTVLDGAVNVSGLSGESIDLQQGFSTMVYQDQSPLPPVEVNVEQYRQQETLSSDSAETVEDGDEGQLANAPVSPDNPVQRVQADPDEAEDLNTSPTTGDLEIIIK